MNDPTKISVGVVAGVGAVSLIGAAVAIYTIVSYRKEISGLNVVIFHENMLLDHYREQVRRAQGAAQQRDRAADRARAQREREQAQEQQAVANFQNEAMGNPPEFPHVGGGKRPRKTRGKKHRSQRRSL